MSNLQRLTIDLYGIENWLRSQGYKVTNKTVADMTAAFLKSKGLKYHKFNPRYKGLFTAAIFNAPEVQQHFKEFKTFILNNYKPQPNETNKSVHNR